MRSRITPLFAKFVADDIKNHFTNDANVFLGIGRSLAFGANASNVEDVIFTTNKITELYDNLVGMKKIGGSDMQVVLARRDWIGNVIYDAYEDDIRLFSFDKFTAIGTANANANTTLTGTASIIS